MPKWNTPRPGNYRVPAIALFLCALWLILVGFSLALAAPGSLQDGTPPAPMPTPLPAAQPDWNQLPLLGPLVRGLRSLGGETLVAGVIIFLLGLLVGNFKKVLSLLERGFRRVGAALRSQSKDFAFEQAYLEWLISQHRHLGMLPAQVADIRKGEWQKLVDLENVYINLSLSTQAGDEEWASSPADQVSRWRKSPSRLLRFARFVVRTSLAYWSRFTEQGSLMQRYQNAWLVSESAYEPGSVGLVVDRYPRLILRGDPGCGKTTLLRYLAVTCARAVRNNRREQDSRFMARQRLQWTTRPFPILVRLNRQENVVNWGEQRGLLEAFRDEMPFVLRKRCPEGFFERQLHERPCLVLLDAFDELGSTDARTAMAQHIQGFLNVYGKPMHRMVVTTRIVGYENQLDRFDFDNRTVQQLQDGQVRALIKQRYKAFALDEASRHRASEEQAIEQRLSERAERLIQKVEQTPRLRQLVTNPMLLSLIVLVHYLKVELPEERVLLYRDCVEILTERWEKAKREESGAATDSRQSLSLSQKIVLLRDLAFAMQQRRDTAGSQALIPLKTACRIIAGRLPDFLGFTLPPEPKARQEQCLRLAEDWLADIQVVSGILVAQGLDQDGEQLIGFSHLTFQEYLAALALNEIPELQGEIYTNLLNPAWREVVLLFVLLVEDATPLLQALLDAQPQPGGLLLAGHCLAERVLKVAPGVQGEILERLKGLFAQDTFTLLEETGEILGSVGGLTITPVLLAAIDDPYPPRQRVAIRALRNLRDDDPWIDPVRQKLVVALDQGHELPVKIAARETLAVIGDPRFTAVEPVMLPLPLDLPPVPSITMRDFRPGVKPSEARWDYYIRLVDARLYSLTRPWLKKWVKDGFGACEIARYPVTNLEYSRFVQETGTLPPPSWIEGVYPQEKATHPVVGLNYSDARRYCRWLSRKTGKSYRLPTEWEWEAAASGPDGARYPWGTRFDRTRCNTREADLADTTTPVGTFFDVKSPYGLQDTCGGVRECTIGLSSFFFLVFTGSFALFALLLMLSILFGSPNTATWFILLFLLLAGTGFLAYPVVAFWAAVLSNGSLDGTYMRIIRGGSWRTSYSYATCYTRIFTQGTLNHIDLGFRLARSANRDYSERLAPVQQAVSRSLKSSLAPLVMLLILVACCACSFWLFGDQLTGSYYAGQGNIWAARGDAGQAAAWYHWAVKKSPKNALYWNKLCWYGSLSGNVAGVLPACEEAVRLEPKDGNYRDSRGLARALTGDPAGAIEDFTFFTEWTRNLENQQTIRLQRLFWIAELTAGRDPFDPATLQGLVK